MRIVHHVVGSVVVNVYVVVVGVLPIGAPTTTLLGMSFGCCVSTNFPTAAIITSASGERAQHAANIRTCRRQITRARTHFTVIKLCLSVRRAMRRRRRRRR